MRRCPILFALLLAPSALCAQSSFVNWENPHVHPLEISPDGNTLLAVNTPDNRLEIFSIDTGTARHEASVPVGLDPVTVRARGDSEAWVVNHVSDSVSIINIETGNVVRTLSTDDEPADVVFAGSPERAFVSCSHMRHRLRIQFTTRLEVMTSLKPEKPGVYGLCPASVRDVMNRLGPSCERPNKVP